MECELDPIREPEEASPSTEFISFYFQGNKTLLYEHGQNFTPIDCKLTLELANLEIVA